MKLIRIAGMAAGALGLATVAGAAAYADPINTTPATDAFSMSGEFAPKPNQITPQASHRSLQWDAKTGRWGLKFDMSQPADRDVTWRDAQVGAFYRVTPSLRVGPAVSFGSDQPPDPQHPTAQTPAPRVRLETTFKF
ncbi:MAG: NtrZ family periplasmic regulatory protein [Caulobacterales bacterium]